jgi:hypothetical protein
MLGLIDKLKPHSVVEIGVHRALRAASVCERALRYGPVDYVGYDVFETMDQAFQEAAMNGKGMPTQAEAAHRLRRISDRWRPQFAWRFVVGDTRKTLHGRHIKADFVFIDGDHRVEAIEGDYAALAGSPCVVFDDYYVPDAAGKLPIDLERFGCNKTVDRLAGEGRKVEILPAADPCKHGGMIKLAVVRA